MQTIFLDVDGVLNTDKSRLIAPFEFVPDAIFNLYSLVVSTNANIIISSSWRLAGIGPTSDFQKTLKNSCKLLLDGDYIFDVLRGKICGCTDDLFPESRESEILAFVNHHRIEKFIAIDDESINFPNNPDWLILTNNKVGFNKQILKVAFSKLK